MEVIGQYVATPPFIEPLQIEHTSMKPLYPIIELIEFCLELALEIQLCFGDSLRFGASLRRFASLRSFTSEIRFASELHFGDSLRFGASLRRFASLRSFTSEIRFALRRFTSLRSFTLELSAEKLPFSASILNLIVLASPMIQLASSKKSSLDLQCILSSPGICRHQSSEHSMW